ncbi:MAG: hypothetical protein WAP49_01960, partial [Mycobacterium sp.]
AGEGYRGGAAGDSVGGRSRGGLARRDGTGAGTGRCDRAVSRSARQLRLRIDATWRWAAAIATAWQRLRAAFP